MKRGVSKQDGQTSSSLNWPTARALFQGHRTTSCTNRYFRGRSTELSQRIGLKFGRPIWSKSRFKRYNWRAWRVGENCGEKKRIALNHQYRYRIEDSDTRSVEFRQRMHSMQLTWPHCRRRDEEIEDRRRERCNNAGLLSDQKRRAVRSTSVILVTIFQL